MESDFFDPLLWRTTVLPEFRLCHHIPKGETFLTKIETTFLEHKISLKCTLIM